VQVVERVALAPRQSLLLVRAGERALLLGVGESGPPALLAELDPGVLGPSSQPSRSGGGQVQSSSAGGARVPPSPADGGQGEGEA
jgi:flagellar biogenesis protein FliO